MARIISSVATANEISNRGERIVYASVQTALPNHFLVFYSLPFIREHKDSGTLVDGENDFVFLDLKRGVILYAEVKEGTIRTRVDGNQQKWFQNDRLMSCSPWQQAVVNKYSLTDWLCRALDCTRSEFPLSTGHTVLLPDAHAGAIACAADITAETAIPWDSPEMLATRIEACSAAWCQKGRRNPSDVEIDAVRKLLMPDFVYGNRLADRIGVERRDLPASSLPHDLLLDFIGNRRRARISGCAGSGKTILAVALARRLAAEGKRVLFLVYNEALCGYIKAHLEDQPGIDMQVFHTFCRTCCGKAWPSTPPNTTAFWWEQAPELLDTALRNARPLYDAILVDEAQDFRFGAWIALEQAIQPDGWYYLFYDEQQNVFAGDRSWPVEEPPFLLANHCRSTRAITTAIEKYTGMRLPIAKQLPEGQPVTECGDRAPGQRRRLLGKILHEWICKEGLTENQIIVLGAHSIEHTCMENTGKAGSFRIVERGTAAKGVVPYFTYMAYKGCEADAVILLDVDPADPRWNQDGLYTAMTRARQLLAIIQSSPAIP